MRYSEARNQQVSFALCMIVSFIGRFSRNKATENSRFPYPKQNVMRAWKIPFVRAPGEFRIWNPKVALLANAKQVDLFATFSSLAEPFNFEVLVDGAAASQLATQSREWPWRHSFTSHPLKIPSIPTPPARNHNAEKASNTQMQVLTSQLVQLIIIPFQFITSNYVF